MKDRVIVALDTQDQLSLDTLLKELKDEVQFVKVGMELFYTFGPQIVTQLKEMNYKVFLDLKLHDIPNTVKSSVKVITKLGADIINVHARGGKQMLEAAVEGVNEAMAEHPELLRPKLIGVTQLTSTTEDSLKEDMGIDINLSQNILHLSKLCFNSGLDGVVCSAFEVKMIKETTSQNFLCITPGIRPLNSSVNDQKRVMTPAQAIAAGSDYLVIGRPITKASSPKNAFKDIMKELI